jgi:anti-anti-sigma factor
MKERIVAGLPLLDRVTLGDHVCWAVDDDAIRMEAIASFVRAGLDARHLVLYCGDDPRAVLDGLSARGVDTGAALAAGLLAARTGEETYLTGGHFEPATTLARWRDLLEAARGAGRPGIRVVGDMTWATRGVPGAHRLGWYEAQVNTLLTDGFVAAVCAYDRRVFDPIALRPLIWAHPGSAGSEMPFDPDSALRARRTRDPYGLRLYGEVDLSNRAALAAVVDHVTGLAPPGADVTVDLSGLRFADAAAARLLVRAAATGPGRLHVTGCSPAMLRLFDFHGAAAVPTLTVHPEAF